MKIKELNINNYIEKADILGLCKININKPTATILLKNGTALECEYVTPAKDLNKKLCNDFFIKDDIFTVNVRICEDDNTLKNILENLKDALNSKKITKVIIDARSNPGGNSDASKKLLDTLGLVTPEYGSLTRFSDYAKNERNYSINKGVFVYPPSLNYKYNENNIPLCILCDEYTCSSALMLCVWVQDGKLGTIVGKHPACNINHYGDRLEISLKHSKAIVHCSHKKWVRPNGNLNENILAPDILVTENENAYRVAFEYLSKL